MISTETPPRGGAVSTEAAHAAADNAARNFGAPQPSFPMGGMRADPGATLGEPRLAPSLQSVQFDEFTSFERKPPPATVFDWIDRGWRPGLGVICGVGFFYNFVAAPLFDQRENDESKLWVLAAVATALAGAKTVERNKIGTPAGLFGGPALVTR